jgi:anti-sigma B factor antagonist
VALTDVRITSAELGPDTCVISLGGELDLASSDRLMEEIDRVLAGDYRRLIVDLSAVTFLDSTALGVLTSAATRVRARGGEIVLVSDDPKVVRVFQITGLDRVFRLQRSLSEALDELVGRVARA